MPHNFFVNKTDKPNFDFCISELSNELKEEIRFTDEKIKKLKPLKFKRKIEATGGHVCRINYISDYGFAYHIHTDKNMAYHYMSWIIYNTKREQEKYGLQKNDLTEKTLLKLSETSPEFALHMFNNLKECIGCACGGAPKPCNLDGCILCENRTIGHLCPVLIKYNGKKKAACHGKMEFTATVDDFVDARRVMEAVNEILLLSS